MCVCEFYMLRWWFYSSDFCTVSGMSILNHWRTKDDKFLLQSIQCVRPHYIKNKTLEDMTERPVTSNASQLCVSKLVIYLHLPPPHKTRFFSCFNTYYVCLKCSSQYLVSLWNPLILKLLVCAQPWISPRPSLMFSWPFF